MRPQGFAPGEGSLAPLARKPTTAPRWSRSLSRTWPGGVRCPAAAVPG